jgi:hypothetical protein
MSAMTMLSGGDKYYSYSGEIFGDVSAPATIQMILIPNTGLRDSYVKIQPFYDTPVSNATANQLGLLIKLDDVSIYKSKLIAGSSVVTAEDNYIELFIPRQSKLELVSLNNASNNTQIRGVNLIGYYL